MEKKILIFILIILLGIPFVLSLPQFLLLKGKVFLDGRTVPQAQINFSINNTTVASTVTNASGDYQVFIQGFEEFYRFPIRITIDGYDAEQELSYVYPQDINLNLSASTGKSLKVFGSFPSENIVEVRKIGIQNFNLSIETGYNDAVNHSWFLDGEKVHEIFNKSSSSFNYNINGSDKGEHIIKVIVTDGFDDVSKEWKLVIERPETSGFDGDTTDFSSFSLSELENVSNVVLEKTGKGKIEFLEELNLTGVTDILGKVKLEKGLVAIDTSFYPQLNKPAKITLTGLSYETIPEIFYSSGFTIDPPQVSEKCDFCRILSYTQNPTTNGVIVFEVEHFSSFKAGESGDKYNFSSFKGLDICRNGVIGNLDLDLRDPNDGETFNFKDKLKARADVENNANEDKDIIVEVSLYNFDNGDVEEFFDDEKDVKSGDTERFDFSFTDLKNLDEGDYLLYVKSYEDRNEISQCIEDAVEINLERDEHEVVIKDFLLDYDSVIAGQNISAFVEMQNIGSSNEDVYIEIEIRELDISSRSTTFELERFGENDFAKRLISLEIPENASVGDYTLEISAVFDGRRNKKTKSISIFEDINKEKTSIKLQSSKIDSISEAQKIFEDSFFIYVLLYLEIMAGILFTIIIKLRK